MADHPPGGAPGHSGHSHGTDHIDADDRHWDLQPHCGTDPGEEREVHFVGLKHFQISETVFKLLSVIEPGVSNQSVKVKDVL